VKDISLTRTTLREENGRLISVPNSIFIDNKIIKYPKGDFFKFSFQLKISNNSNIEKIKKIILDVCNKNEKILPNIPKKQKTVFKKYAENTSEDRQGFFGLLQRKVDIKQFEPVVLLCDINQNILTFNVFIWTWDVKNKDMIISEIMGELLKEFSKNEIKLV
jgi:small-conductance mechanosensitive channel